MAPISPLGMLAASPTRWEQLQLDVAMQEPRLPRQPPPHRVAQQPPAHQRNHHRAQAQLAATTAQAGHAPAAAPLTFPVTR